MARSKRSAVDVRLSVRSLDGTRGPDRKLLRSVAEEAVSYMGPGSYVVEIAYADDKIMRRLNKRFHDRSGTTDVLAFPSFMDTPEGVVVGEVVVNRDAARRSSEKGGGTTRETLRYVAHGILHLAGFDDHSDAGRRRMWKEQEEVLKSALT